MNPVPDIHLKFTGRTIRHTPQPDGTQRATPTTGPNAMLPDEWLEYCDIVRQLKPDPFAYKLKTSAALRSGDTEFLRKPAHSMDDNSQPPA